MTSANDHLNVPADFPRQPLAGAVGGSQPKLLLREYQGRYYQPGTSPDEVYVRWDACEEFAKGLSAKALESASGKRSHMSHEDILAQYLPRIIQMGWATEAESKWMIRRMAFLLDWPTPPCALE